jgi:hypothetical protein
MAREIPELGSENRIDQYDFAYYLDRVHGAVAAGPLYLGVFIRRTPKTRGRRTSRCT